MKPCISIVAWDFLQSVICLKRFSACECCKSYKEKLDTNRTNPIYIVTVNDFATLVEKEVLLSETRLSRRSYLSWLAAGVEDFLIAAELDREASTTPVQHRTIKMHIEKTFVWVSPAIHLGNENEKKKKENCTISIP